MKLTTNQKAYILLIVVLHLLVIFYIYRPGRPKLDSNNRIVREADTNKNIPVPSPIDISAVPESTESFVLGTDKPYKLLRFLDGMIFISIPEALSETSESEKAQKYQGLKIPVGEYVSPDGLTAFQVDFYNPDDVRDATIQELATIFTDSITKQYENVQWNERSIREISDREYAILDFSINQEDGAFRSIMSFSKIAGRYMYTSFSFPIDQEAIWFNDVSKTLESVESEF